ncbi:hypothetical protein niasHS_017240 [Heterodera schachtii]|uniref:Polymerase nucleotidyl transferase domain-containing protein n=1 Tax=Heterodera schachtii TaxID=97005 RepID=A0ABD2IBW7_HETSC
MIPTTILHRFNTLLLNRSNSEPYKDNFVRWTIALLIWDIEEQKMLALLQLNSIAKVHGLNSFWDQIKSLISETLRNPKSEQNACVLIKLSELFLIPKKALPNIARMASKWRKECEEKTERETALRRFVGSANGVLYKQWLSIVFQVCETAKVGATVALMQKPGAKTRLKKVMGKRTLAEELLTENNLAHIYENDVFFDNDRLLEHYTFGMEKDVPLIERKSHKFGADVVVFMRWFERKSERHIGTEKLQLIIKYMDNQIYDPIFDQDEQQLDKLGPFLKTLFVDAKTFVEKIKNKNSGEEKQKVQKNIFKQWKLMVENAHKTEQGNGDDKIGEMDEWISKLHANEFLHLMLNEEKLRSLKNILIRHGPDKVRENLLDFVNENVATNILNKLNTFEIVKGNKPKLILKLDENGGELNKQKEENEKEETENDQKKEEQQKVADDEQKEEKKEENWENANKFHWKIIGDEDDEFTLEKEGIEQKQKHVSCPAKSLSIEQIRKKDEKEIPEELLLVLLKCLLIDYLKSDLNESGKMTILFRLFEYYCSIWYLNGIAHKTLKVMERMAPKGSAFEKEVAKLKEHHREMNDNFEFDKCPMDEQQRPDFVYKSLLIRVFRFLEHIANNKTLIENSADWNTYREENMQKWIGTESAEQWAIPKFSAEESHRIFIQFHSDNSQMVNNTVCVGAIIRRFGEVQRFFCALSVPTEMQNVKIILKTLLVEPMLLLLEERHPEVLKFDAPVSTTEVIRYKHFLQQKSGSVSAFFAGVRLALPILLQKLRTFVADNIPRIGHRPPIRLALEKAIEKIRLNAFIGVRTPKTQAKTFCIVQKFINYMEMALELHANGAQMIKTEAIANWRAEKCESEAEQWRVFESQSEILSLEHFAMLTMYIIFCEHESIFLDSIIGEDDTSRRMFGKLSVFIAVWVPFLDDELCDIKENRTNGQQEVDKVLWFRKREQIAEIYDGIMDDQMDELNIKGEMVRELVIGLFRFVRAKRTGSIRKGRDRNGHEKEAVLKLLNSDDFAEFENEIALKMGQENGEKNEKMDKEKAKADQKMKELIGEEKRTKKKNKRARKTKQRQRSAADQKEGESEQKEEKGKERKGEESERISEESEQKEEKRKEKTEEESQWNTKESEQKEEKGKERTEEESQWNTKESEQKEEKGKERKGEESGQEIAREENDVEIVNEQNGDSVTTEEIQRQRQENGEETMEKGGKASAEKEGEKCHRMLGAQLAKVNLGSFILNSFLHSNYQEFMANPNESKRCLLDIGVYVNEIWHRMEIIGILGNFTGVKWMENAGIVVNWEKRMKLWHKWKKMEREFANICTTFDEELESNLHKMLKSVILTTEGILIDDGQMEEKSEQNERKKVKMQLHLNKFAKLIIWQKRFENDFAEKNWENLDETEQNNILKMLTFNRNDKKLAHRFNEHLENWRKLTEQRRIDRKLFDQFYKHTTHSFGLGSVHLGVNFAENTQQIYFGSANNDRMHLSFINELLTENGYTDCPSVELALDKVKQIVSKWSNNEARLLLTGSYALGTHARGSDIDAICIVPQKLGKKEQREHFHGTAFCDLDKKVAQRQCEDNSLYCHFCKEPKIQFLNKIPSAYCPMVQLKLANIEFDLSFVAIPPNADALPNEPIQANEVERMMAQLANQTIPQEAMLQALSGE